jgi:transcriptional regulator with XRE-family HTH domain
MICVKFPAISHAVARGNARLSPERERSRGRRAFGARRHRTEPSLESARLSPKRELWSGRRELIAEEKSLQELRLAHKLTQKRMAEVLGVGQDSVSRLEQRSDLLLSTLRGCVEALGGRLSLVAQFSDRDPVILSGIAAQEPGGRRSEAPGSRTPHHLTPAALQSLQPGALTGGVQRVLFARSRIPVPPERAGCAERILSIVQMSKQWH